MNQLAVFRVLALGAFAVAGCTGSMSEMQPEPRSTSSHQAELNSSSRATDVTAYPFEPAIVVVSGVLEKEVKFGPPNYGETPEVDRQVTVYVLKLSTPINVGTNKEAGEVGGGAPVIGVRELQIVFSTHSLGFERSVGSLVAVSGRLSAQQLGQDFYPIVLREASIR